jgi:hypothetical protein
LPCSILAQFLPGLEHLGPGAYFRGFLWANHREETWDGELAGELTGIELERLVTHRYPHRLGGTAQLAIKRASFRRGRLERADGRFTAGPGVISGSLWSAAVDALYLTPTANPRGPDELIDYQQLAFTFAVDRNGVILNGACASAPGGTMLTAQAPASLREPTSQPLPVSALVRMLVPRSDVLVPATRETDFLTRVLPLRSAMPPRVARHPSSQPPP